MKIYYRKGGTREQGGTLFFCPVVLEERGPFAEPHRIPVCVDGHRFSLGSVLRLERISAATICGREGQPMGVIFL